MTVLLHSPSSLSGCLGACLSPTPGSDIQQREFCGLWSGPQQSPHWFPGVCPLLDSFTLSIDLNLITEPTQGNPSMAMEEDQMGLFGQGFQPGALIS